MGGTSKTQSVSQGASISQPWQPAQPALEGILAGINAGIPSYSPTPIENQALSQLTTNAQNAPNFGGQAATLANNYLGGDPTGLLSPALTAYRAQLNPIANQNNDPMQTPGIRALLDTIRSDVTNSVNSQFVGAGRDLSGMNQQTLARGISQGEAAPLLAQYNANVAAQTGAAGNVYDATGNTASALTGNQLQGFNIANLVPGFQNAPAMQTLAAQQARRQLPLQNLGMLENLTVPIAGLGGQTNTYNQQTGYQTASPAQTAAMWGAALGGGNGGGLFGAAGTGLAALSKIFS